VHTMPRTGCASRDMRREDLIQGVTGRSCHHKCPEAPALLAGQTEDARAIRHLATRMLSHLRLNTVLKTKKLLRFPRVSLPRSAECSSTQPKQKLLQYTTGRGRSQQHISAAACMLPVFTTCMSLSTSAPTRQEVRSRGDAAYDTRLPRQPSAPHHRASACARQAIQLALSFFGWKAAAAGFEQSTPLQTPSLTTSNWLVLLTPSMSRHLPMK